MVNKGVPAQVRKKLLKESRVHGRTREKKN